MADETMKAGDKSNKAFHIREEQINTLLVLLPPRPRPRQGTRYRRLPYLEQRSYPPAQHVLKLRSRPRPRSCATASSMLRPSAICDAHKRPFGVLLGAPNKKSN